MKLDYLAIGAHPDDLEIFVSGTFLCLQEHGYKVGFCDLSNGEMGTYGDTKLRASERDKAQTILGLSMRVSLNLPDGSIRNTHEARLKVINLLRQYRPRAVVSFGEKVLRHPDHYHTGQIVKECCFLAGLEKLQTEYTAYKPEIFFQFSELLSYEKPDFIMDISRTWEKKIQAIECYSSQVLVEKHHGTVSESPPKTFIKSAAFRELLIAKSKWLGAFIGASYGEGFFVEHPIRLTDPLKHLSRP